MSFTVEVQPSGVSFDAEAGETIMAAARRAGIRWPTVCGGLGECAVCFVEVASDENLEPCSNLEKSILERSINRPRNGGVLRLACQLRVPHDLSVYRLGIRPPPTK